MAQFWLHFIWLPSTNELPHLELYHQIPFTDYNRLIKRPLRVTPEKMSGNDWTFYLAYVCLKKLIEPEYLQNPFFFVAAGIYLLKVNNRNTGTRCEICSKFAIKTPEQRQASFWYL